MARITQGTFSLLPDLTDDQIKKQVEYSISKGYAVGLEWTDDPHPRNCYWELGITIIRNSDSATVMYEL
jgi:ribulose-bisphosphate carboxylase small chain